MNIDYSQLSDQELQDIVDSKPKTYDASDYHLSGLHPDMKQRWESLALDYFNATGEPLKMRSGYRSTEHQTRLYEADLAAHGGKPSGYVAPPGGSSHEDVSGQGSLAIDLDKEQVPKLEKHKLIDKYFNRPLMGQTTSGIKEPWHIEHPEARTNPVFTTRAEQKAEKVAAKVPIDYSKLSDEELNVIANQGVDYSKMTDEELSAIASKAPSVLQDKYATAGAGQTPQERQMLATPSEIDQQDTAKLTSLIAGPAQETNLLGALEIVDLPIKYGLRKPLEYLHEKLIEPSRVRTEEEFAKFIQEPGAGTAAPEAFGPLPSKEVFVPTMEVAAFPSFLKAINKVVPAGKILTALTKNIPQTIVGETIPSMANLADVGTMENTVMDRLMAMRGASPLGPYSTIPEKPIRYGAGFGSLDAAPVPILPEPPFIPSQYSLPQSLNRLLPPGPPPVTLRPTTPIANQNLLEGLGITQGTPPNELLQSVLGRGDEPMARLLDAVKKVTLLGGAGVAGASLLGPDEAQAGVPPTMIKAIGELAGMGVKEGLPLIETTAKIAAKYGVEGTKLYETYNLFKRSGGIDDLLKNLPKELNIAEDIFAVGSKVSLAPEVSKILFDATIKPVAELGQPTGDISPRILGEFSLETKPYQFDRIDRMLPGAKDSVYWRQKQLEKISLEEVQSLTNTSREWEIGLPKGSSRDIMLNAVNAQKGGPAILEAMGIKDVPTLGPAQEAALGKLRNSFDEIFPRLNEARVAAGKEPIDAVENYFTFFRQLNTAAKENVNPVLVRKEWFNPALSELDFTVQRVKSDLPLVTDAFKVYRNYVRGVVPWIHQAPHLQDTLNLAGTFLESAPNLAFSLKRWVSNIQGTDIPKHLGMLDAPLRKLTNNVSISVLGGYARSAMAQPASLIGAGAEIGPRFLVQGIAESMIPSRVRFALDNSLVLKTREFDVSVVDAIERMISDTMLGKIKRGATSISYTPLQYMDAKSAQVAWLGAYKKAISKKLDNPIKYADEVVIKTQGSAARSDISDIQTHAIGKALTQFQTFIISDYNYITKELMGIRNPDITKREQLRKVINYVVGATLLNTAMDELGLPTPIPSPISDMRRAADERKSTFTKVAGAGLASLTQKLPIIGGSMRFGGSLGGPMVNFAENIIEGKETMPTAAMKLLGVPGTTQLQKFLPVITGDEDVTPETLRTALFGKTADQYAEDKRRKNKAPEKLFLQGLRGSIDESLDGLVDLMRR
jgi:hypothetical protein